MHPGDRPPQEEFLENLASAAKAMQVGVWRGLSYHATGKVCVLAVVCCVLWLLRNEAVEHVWLVASGIAQVLNLLYTRRKLWSRP